MLGRFAFQIPVILFGLFAQATEPCREILTRMPTARGAFADFPMVQLQETERLWLVTERPWTTLSGRNGRIFLVQKSDSTVIGDIQLIWESDFQAHLPIELLMPYRRQGYAFEGKRALMERVYAEGGQTIRAEIQPSNRDSVRLHERLGFVLEPKPGLRNLHYRHRKIDLITPRAE